MLILLSNIPGKTIRQMGGIKKPAAKTDKSAVAAGRVKALVYLAMHCELPASHCLVGTQVVMVTSWVSETPSALVALTMK